MTAGRSIVAPTGFSALAATKLRGATTIVQLPGSISHRTLDHMNDSWLDSGHGPEPTHLATIYTSAARTRATGIDHSLDTPNRFTTADPPRRARPWSHLLVVAALWLGIAVGTAGAAYAVRDALFPSIGPAAVSVWQNPGREPEEPATDDSSSTTTTTAAVLVSTAPAATEVSVVAAVASSVSSSEPGSSDSSGDRTVHTGSTISPGPTGDNTTSSVDDHGGGGSGSGSGSGSGGSSGSGGGSDSGGGSGSGGSSKP